MSSAYRVNRKVSDEDIVRLNSLGLSLRTISEIHNCHQTTITLRLRQLGIEPADTRRSFMEDIVRTMTPAQQEWLVEQLGPQFSIKDYIRNLLSEQYMNHQKVINGRPDLA